VRKREAVDRVPDPWQAKESLERALFEIRKVIAGQDVMLERVLVCLLTGGHLLIEGVPGLAKTLTVKTTAGVLGGSFSRIQFTPDLVPSDLVGKQIYRPETASFDTQLGPVFCNFLLADEINRAPAKVQSALLEVMQERQVTIGHTTHKVPDPFLVMATQNPIESEGTYPLPEAQVDRFMLKILVDYPLHDEEVTVVVRSLQAPPELKQVLSIDDLRALQRVVDSIYVDPDRRVVARKVQHDPARGGRALQVHPGGGRGAPADGGRRELKRLQPRRQHREGAGGGHAVERGGEGHGRRGGDLPQRDLEVGPAVGARHRDRRGDRHDGGVRTRQGDGGATGRDARR